MERIKQLRQNIDHLMLSSKELGSNRELSLAYTNMQRGSMWLGLVLAAIGTANPYPESTNTSNEKIEERTDQAKDSPAMFEGMPTENRTIQVKWFREKLDNMVEVLTDIHKYADLGGGQHELSIAIDALREAKMWFGWELNNIFNEAKKA